MSNEIDDLVENEETPIEEAVELDGESEDGPVLLGTVRHDLPDDHKSGFVSVVGQPNVGKSTLLNAFLQQKIAIVSPRPQTTRTRQLGIVTEPDHQIVFIDTPGIMEKAMHKLDEAMLDSAVEGLNDGDIILWIVDSSFPPNAQDERVAKMISEARGEPILVMNKNDLVPPQDVLDRTDAYRGLLPADAKWFFISAERKAGVEDVYAAIKAALPEGPRYYPEHQITDTFTRDIAAEMVREQILRQIRDEVPHGVAVKVVEFKEDEEPLHIRVNIFVERESHKPILIGAHGSQLKSIGQAAREDIEKLLDQQIFLDLWVKVAPRWRREEKQIERFGYAPD